MGLIFESPELLCDVMETSRDGREILRRVAAKAYNHVGSNTCAGVDNPHASFRL